MAKWLELCRRGVEEAVEIIKETVPQKHFVTSVATITKNLVRELYEILRAAGYPVSLSYEYKLKDQYKLKEVYQD